MSFLKRPPMSLLMTVLTLISSSSSSTTFTTTTTTTTTTNPTFQLPPSSFSQTQCSTSSKLGTPTYGNEGIVFTTCSERNISSSIDEIYDAILTFSEYQHWNSFVVDVKDREGEEIPRGVLGVGTKMTFTTRGLLPAGFETSSDEVVSFTEREVDVSADGEGGEEEEGRVAVCGWKFEGVGQRAEHVNVLVELGGGVTRYVSWESYYGLVAPVTRILEGNLKKGFEKQADDLKMLVEG